MRQNAKYFQKKRLKSYDIIETYVIITTRLSVPGVSDTGIKKDKRAKITMNKKEQLFL